MNITVLCMGKTREAYLREGMAGYEARLKHYVPLRWVELPDIKARAARTQEQIKEEEGQLLLAQLRPQDRLILLDERGDSFTSVEMSRRLERFMHEGRDLALMIGGAYGFSEKVYARAQGLWSLSKLTFSHQMIRLLLLEQVYRSFTILKGEPYHHA